jgi:hypothetical protein
VFDVCGVCGGGGIDDLGCGCFEDGPSGCDNTCGSTLEDDACGDCGGNGSACIDTITGCMDNTACNFDFDVTFDNGSCWSAIEGCDCSYGEGAVVDDCGVCDGDGTSCSLSIENHIAESFSINSIYPNPFNPVVNIDLSIDIAGHLQISIFTIDGTQIKTIYNGPSGIGESTFIWTPKNRASGFYFINAILDDQVETQKVLLLK